MNSLSSSTVFTKLNIVRVVRASAIALGALFITGQARADIFEDIGLTGGGNSANIIEVKGKGKLTFHKNDYTGGKDAVTDFTGPLVSAEIFCKRSGYRCSRLGETALSPKKNHETGDVNASLAKDDAVNKTLDAACKAKKTTVQVPVTVTGQCEKVKFAVGKEHYKVSSETKTANFDLVCEGYAP